MAADPTLADRLDDLANDRRWDCWAMHGERVQHLPEGYEPSIDCCDAAEGFHSLRAAAVRLRKLDAIEEAAAAQGDADGLHLLADGLRGFRFTSSSANFIDRIADALGGTE